MNRVAKFSKISFEQFKKDWENIFGYWTYSAEDIKNIYDNIKLPKRATKDSAGNDFFLPIDLLLQPNQTMKIPTGIRCEMDEGWVLKLYPRSGLGFKYRLQLDNVVGIIDGDYFYSDNEGHIMAKMTNCTTENKTLFVKQGEGFMQGIFLEYGITVDDDADGIRNGGFGSTTGKNE